MTKHKITRKEFETYQPKDNTFLRKMAKHLEPPEDTPKDTENLVLTSGTYFDPSPDDDHEAHIQKHLNAKASLQDKVLRGSAPASRLHVLESHIEAHKIFKGEVKTDAPEPADVPQGDNLDSEALQKIYDRYARVYSGKWIAKALTAWKSGDFEDAEYAFQKSRDGFQEEKSPQEWNTLETWRVAAEKKLSNESEPAKPDKTSEK